MNDFFPIYVVVYLGVFALFCGFFALYYFVKIVSFFTSDDNEQEQGKGEQK